MTARGAAREPRRLDRARGRARRGARRGERRDDPPLVRRRGRSQPGVHRPRVRGEVGARRDRGAADHAPGVDDAPACARPSPRPREPAPFSEVMRLLDAAGYTSVVATNCRQEYRRYLREGDLLNVTTRVAVVSDEKTTALGVGRFVDEEMIYRDAAGEEVARMTFRLLKFKPPARPARRSAAPRPAPARRRPRPAQSPDNAFFWQGVAAGELRIQRCTGCKALRHPPGPMCPRCHSLDWDYLAASGRGHVYSFVVAHHPPVPPFSYPNAIALIELDEGTRLVSNLVGIDPADIAIGLRVRVEFTARRRRAGSPPVPARSLLTGAPRADGSRPWISPPPKSSSRSATSRGDLRRPRHPRAAARAREAAASGSTPSCGASSRARASPRSRFPRRTAAAGSGCRSCARCSRSRAATPRPCRCSPPRCSARCRSPSSERPSSASAGCARSPSARRCSPRRCSSTRAASRARRARGRSRAAESGGSTARSTASPPRTARA